MHPGCDECDEDSTHEVIVGRTLPPIEMPIIKYFCDKHYDEYMERKDKK